MKTPSCLGSFAAEYHFHAICLSAEWWHNAQQRDGIVPHSRLVTPAVGRKVADDALTTNLEVLG